MTKTTIAHSGCNVVYNSPNNSLYELLANLLKYPKTYPIITIRITKTIMASIILYRLGLYDKNKNVGVKYAYLDRNESSISQYFS